MKVALGGETAFKSRSPFASLTTFATFALRCSRMQIRPSSSTSSPIPPTILARKARLEGRNFLPGNEEKVKPKSLACIEGEIGALTKASVIVLRDDGGKIAKVDDAGEKNDFFVVEEVGGNKDALGVNDGLT